VAKSYYPNHVGIKEEKLLWIIMRNKLTRRFGFLTDKDLKYDEGKKAMRLNVYQSKFDLSSSNIMTIFTV
jgi:hypothetical protein